MSPISLSAAQSNLARIIFCCPRFGGCSVSRRSRRRHLVIVGAPRWRGQPILDQMFGCAATRGKIHHVAELSTPALKPLIAGSLGLLSPSLTEGFGLPIIEALHLGVPVVASDIPAHREVAGGRAILLDPNDDAAWGSAVAALSSDQSGQRVARSATDAISGTVRVSRTQSLSFSRRSNNSLRRQRASL